MSAFLFWSNEKLVFEQGDMLTWTKAKNEKVYDFLARVCLLRETSVVCVKCFSPVGLKLIDADTISEHGAWQR